ncbi:unnamed protein product, partial [Allacma fusca]
FKSEREIFTLRSKCYSCPMLGGVVAKCDLVKGLTHLKFPACCLIFS